jgi:hypothetical protein
MAFWRKAILESFSWDREGGVRDRQTDDKLLQSGVSKLKCTKIGTYVLPTALGWVRDAARVPPLFNINIKELNRTPGIGLLDTEVKYLLFTDDLVLISPTKGRPRPEPRLSAAILPDLGPCRTASRPVKVFLKRPSFQDQQCEAFPGKACSMGLAVFPLHAFSSGSEPPLDF